MTNKILKLSVTEVLKLYGSKELSPFDVAKAVFDQIDLYNPDLNAFALLKDKDTFFEEAKISEKRWQEGKPQGSLDGIPVTIKDGTNVAGWPTREGSLTTHDAPQEKDAILVAKLRSSGAVFLGKTTTPEYGHKGVTDSPAYGVTRNPWNPDKTCGGSSGGAGVAAATRMGFLHHGSDGGGSVRIPASFCGVFGIKPTQGLISGSEPSLFSSLASSGVLATSVQDAAIMMDIISKPDLNDWDCYPNLERNFANKFFDLPKELKVAYVPTINDVAVDREVETIVKDAAKKVAEFAVVEEYHLKIPNLIDVFSKHWAAVAYWLREQFSQDMREKMDPYLLSFSQRGEEIHLKEYLDAELQRLNIIQHVKAVFAEYDAIVMPTIPITAFEAGKNMPSINGEDWEYWTPFTFLANLAKLPAASLPCGLTKEGLPVGIQVISGSFKDSLVFKIAKALEERVKFENWIVNKAKEN